MQKLLKYKYKLGHSVKEINWAKGSRKYTTSIAYNWYSKFKSGYLTKIWTILRNQSRRFYQHKQLKKICWRNVSINFLFKTQIVKFLLLVLFISYSSSIFATLLAQLMFSMSLLHCDLVHISSTCIWVALASIFFHNDSIIKFYTKSTAYIFVSGL